MTFGRLTIALAAIAGTLALASFAGSSTAEARGWRHHRPHYYYGYRSYQPVCWSEWRKVRVHTRHGWRWRDRRVTFCR